MLANATICYYILLFFQMLGFVPQQCVWITELARRDQQPPSLSIFQALYAAPMAP